MPKPAHTLPHRAPPPLVDDFLHYLRHRNNSQMHKCTYCVIREGHDWSRRGHQPDCHLAYLIQCCEQADYASLRCITETAYQDLDTQAGIVYTLALYESLNSGAAGSCLICGVNHRRNEYSKGCPSGAMSNLVNNISGSWQWRDLAIRRPSLWRKRITDSVLTGDASRKTWSRRLTLLTMDGCKCLYCDATAPLPKSLPILNEDSDDVVNHAPSCILNQHPVHVANLKMQAVSLRVANIKDQLMAAQAQLREAVSESEALVQSIYSSAAHKVAEWMQSQFPDSDISLGCRTQNHPNVELYILCDGEPIELYASRSSVSLNYLDKLIPEDGEAPVDAALAEWLRPSSNDLLLLKLKLAEKRVTFS